MQPFTKRPSSPTNVRSKSRGDIVSSHLSTLSDAAKLKADDAVSRTEALLEKVKLNRADTRARSNGSGNSSTGNSPLKVSPTHSPKQSMIGHPNSQDSPSSKPIYVEVDAGFMAPLPRVDPPSSPLRQDMEFKAQQAELKVAVDHSRSESNKQLFALQEKAAQATLLAKDKEKRDREQKYLADKKKREDERLAVENKFQIRHEWEKQQRFLKEKKQKEEADERRRHLEKIQRDLHERELRQREEIERNRIADLEKKAKEKQDRDDILREVEEKRKKRKRRARKATDRRSKTARRT